MSLLQRVFIFAGVLTIAFHQAAFAQEETPTPSPTWNPMNTPAPKPRVTVRPGATLVLVPGGTIVAVSLTEPISSASASVNDEIGVVVKKEVDAGGFVVVPAGAQGEATITTVDRAGGNGHGGQLAMTAAESRCPQRITRARTATKKARRARRRSRPTYCSVR